MTYFQETMGQRIAAYLESIGVSRYRVGGAAVLFQYRGGTHSASSTDEAKRLVFNLNHAEAMAEARSENERDWSVWVTPARAVKVSSLSGFGNE
jgi:hypothetical protein